jgi:hypothetical protein
MAAMSIWRCVLVLLMVVHSLTASSAAKGCVSDLDCSLNGDCLPSGQCDCDAAWEVRRHSPISMHMHVTLHCSSAWPLTCSLAHSIPIAPWDQWLTKAQTRCLICTHAQGAQCERFAQLATPVGADIKELNVTTWGGGPLQHRVSVGSQPWKPFVSSNAPQLTHSFCPCRTIQTHATRDRAY